MTCPDCKGDEMVRDADGWTTCMCVPWHTFLHQQKESKPMTKTVPEIQADLSRITDVLTEKNYVEPIAFLEIKPTGDRFVGFTYGPVEGDYDASHGRYSHGDTPEEVLEKMMAFASSLPDTSIATVINFQKSVADLLEKAKDLGLEHSAIAETINPLTDLMKSLSENIITDQRGVVAE